MQDGCREVSWDASGDAECYDVRRGDHRVDGCDSRYKSDGDPCELHDGNEVREARESPVGYCTAQLILTRRWEAHEDELAVLLGRLEQHDLISG